MGAPIPTKPKLVLPPNSCDSHCHLFGPLSKYPAARTPQNEPDDATLESLATAHEILGIERAVLVHTPVHGTDHAIILDAIKADKSRYRGVGRVDESITEAELQVLHDGGIRGLRYEFLKHFANPPGPDVIHRMANRVQSMGWHLVVLLDGPQLLEMGPLFRALPIPVVIDHMARINIDNGFDHAEFSLLCELIKEGSAWVKISGFGRVSKAGPPYHDVIPFAAKLVETAPDRILWGTDWPHPGPGPGVAPDDGVLVDLLPDIVPDPIHRQKILVGNPTLLYAFED